MAPVLSLNGMSKTYGTTTALDAVSFSVALPDFREVVGSRMHQAAE